MITKKDALNFKVGGGKHPCRIGNKCHCFKPKHGK